MGGGICIQGIITILIGGDMSSSWDCLERMLHNALHGGCVQSVHKVENKQKLDG